MKMIPAALPYGAALLCSIKELGSYFVNEGD